MLVPMLTGIYTINYTYLYKPFLYYLLNLTSLVKISPLFHRCIIPLRYEALHVYITEPNLSGTS
jgi:hypothetical protein